MMKKLSNNSIILKILFLPILIIFLLLLALTFLNIIFGFILASKDGYLLTGFSFYILVSIVIIMIPIILFLLISKKNNRKNDIKRYFKNNKAFSIVLILIIAILESITAYGSHTYFKDIKEGSKEAIMTNAFVKRVRSYKSSGSLHIIGNVDGEEINLKITSDARSKVERNKSYKKIKIEYYENIKEVYDIEYIY